MVQNGLVVITDRGGHLQNAVQLLSKLKVRPEFLLCTPGPDREMLSSQFPETQTIRIPTLFTFIGKKRFLNPYKLCAQVLNAFSWAFNHRPSQVISFGATNVVFYCYFAKLFGAKIFHVDCMNQVTSRSIAGRLLYPICDELFVQWKGLELLYGPRAKYAGWVL